MHTALQSALIFVRLCFGSKDKGKHCKIQQNGARLGRNRIFLFCSLFSPTPNSLFFNALEEAVDGEFCQGKG